MIATDALPIAEALDLAVRIANSDNAYCEALLHRRGAEVCDALRREVLRLRSMLPAIAFVTCPACGTDRDADLDDDAVYIMRRHPRRTTRDGYDEIVWCDGGIVSEGRR